MAAREDAIEPAIHEEHTNLRQTLTISPELFEKVRTGLLIFWRMILTATSCI
jgi:hypothetical protein